MSLFLLTLASVLAASPEPLPIEARLVMLPGLPFSPWEDLTPRMLEEMWVMDISGYQITMSGWSGYLLKGPPGCSEVLDSAAAALAAGPVVPDTSGWARLLQLSWRESGVPAVLEYPFSAGGQTLPLRYSGLLSSPPDTVVVSAPVNNSVLLRTGLFDQALSSSAWRGIGLEVIPSDWGGVPVLLTFAFQGSPGELQNLEYEPHPYDSVWAAGFGALLAGVDSLFAPLASTPDPTLVWVRGTGGIDFIPWTFIPSPGPPLRARVQVAFPDPEGGAPRPWTPPPGTMRLEMPGTLMNREDAEQTGAILERLVARMVLVDHSTEVGIRGVSEGEGKVVLYLENPPWNSVDEALEEIVKALGPLAFTAPEEALLHNASVRASIRLGKTLEPFSPRKCAESVGRVLGLI